MTQELMTLTELSRRTGIAYWRVAYAHQTGRLPEPARAGNHRIYTAEEAAAVERWFRERDGKEGRRARRRESAS